MFSAVGPIFFLLFIFRWFLYVTVVYLDTYKYARTHTHTQRARELWIHKIKTIFVSCIWVFVRCSNHFGFGCKSETKETSTRLKAKQQQKKTNDFLFTYRSVLVLRSLHWHLLMFFGYYFILFGFAVFFDDSRLWLIFMGLSLCLFVCLHAFWWNGASGQIFDFTTETLLLICLLDILLWISCRCLCESTLKCTNLFLFWIWNEVCWRYSPNTTK